VGSFRRAAWCPHFAGAAETDYAWAIKPSHQCTPKWRVGLSGTCRLRGPPSGVRVIGGRGAFLAPSLSPHRIAYHPSTPTAEGTTGLHQLCR